MAARDALGREGPLSAERCFIPSVFLTPSVAPGAGSGELVFGWKAMEVGVDRYDVYWSLLPQADKQLVATLSESADQFGLPWSSPTTRFFVDGVPPRSPRSTVPGLNCYVVVVSLASGQPPTGPASAEVPAVSKVGLSDESRQSAVERGEAGAVWQIQARTVDLASERMVIVPRVRVSLATEQLRERDPVRARDRPLATSVRPQCSRQTVWRQVRPIP